MPKNMAAPTEMPTRWPTPISSIDQLVDQPVAVPPIAKFLPASSATSFILASSANSPEKIVPAISVRRPAAFSRSPAPEAEPTLSTSAAATPSG